MLRELLWNGFKLNGLNSIIFLLFCRLLFRVVKDALNYIFYFVIIINYYLVIKLINRNILL